MKRWLPLVVAVAAAAVFGAVAYALASGDIGRTGDWRNGALRFIGFGAALGLFGGYVVTARLTRGARVTRGGFTLTYPKIVPRPQTYRELTTLTVADLASKLRDLGYEPAMEGCDETGSPRGTLDPTTSLAGCNVAIVDPGVAGWVRLALPVPREAQARGLGVVEMWTRRGESTEELALFVIRSLDALVGDVHAAREDSRTSPDPASLVTASVGERPAHRRR
jgi:hypothetical protein